MGKYYCDYCDIYLTHDSMSARKAHNTGRNHISNVRDYFASLGHDTAQSIIDQIVMSHENGGRAVMMAAPSMRLGAGFMNPMGPGMAQGPPQNNYQQPPFPPAQNFGGPNLGGGPGGPGGPGGGFGGGGPSGYPPPGQNFGGGAPPFRPPFPPSLAGPGGPGGAPMSLPPFPPNAGAGPAGGFRPPPMGMGMPPGMGQGMPPPTLGGFAPMSMPQAPGAAGSGGAGGPGGAAAAAAGGIHPDRLRMMGV